MYFDFLSRFLFSKRAGAIVRRIAWISMLGLAISIAAFVIVLSVMKALNFRIQDRLLAAEPHLWIEIPEVTRAEVLQTHPLMSKLELHSDWRFHIQETQDLILRTLDGRFQGGVGRGLAREGLKAVLNSIEAVGQKQKNLSHLSDSPGVPLGQLAQDLLENEVILGADLAHSLGVGENDFLILTGPEALLLAPTQAPTFEKVRIRAVLSTNLSDVDSKTLFYLTDHSLQKLQKSLSRRLGVELWLPDPQKATEVQQDLQKLSGVFAQTWKERNSALFFALKMERFLIGLFLGQAALVASFSLLSVLGLLISQKRKEFGLMMAMGLGPHRLTGLLRSLGLGIASLGIFLGLLVGSAVSIYLQFFPLQVLPDIYYDSEIPAEWDGFVVFLILIVGYGILWIALDPLSKSLARDTPSELLRNQSQS